jgi:hypothetical protein
VSLFNGLMALYPCMLFPHVLFRIGLGIMVNCLYQCRAVCANVGSEINMNKLLLVGMQLPEKYKENFNVSSEDEGPSL